MNLRNLGIQSTYVGTGTVRGVEMLTLFTGAGNDVVTTLLAFHDDQLTTNAGTDTVTISGGRDTVAMGDGFDTLIVDWSAQTGVYDTVTHSFTGSLATGYTGRYADQYNGSSGYNLVNFSGVERFNIAVGTSNDIIVTGDGNDTVAGGGGSDFLSTGKGADIIDGGKTLASGVLVSGADRWQADKSDATVGLTIDLTAVTSSYVISGITGTVTNIEALGDVDATGRRFATGSSNDVIVTRADYLSDFIDTNAGADTVTVKGGMDIVNMGGNAAGTVDTLIVDWAAMTGTYDFTTFDFAGSLADGYSGRYADVYNGSSGHNRVVFTGVERFNVAVGTTNDYVLTGDGDDTVSGGAGHDHLSTAKGVDVIDGGLGDDRWEADKSALTTAQPFVMNLR
ncbi:calcium-binding protein, partial [Methylobacterium sp. Leaf466]|uniref:calcium-binding protein n=1 Tax=Methylobacterium sp. Leaf466 TaxID=1736386 RepID=UPI000A5FD370